MENEIITIRFNHLSLRIAKQFSNQQQGCNYFILQHLIL
jgi:hypothetical protein